MSEIEELDNLSAHWRHLQAGDKLDRLELDIRSHAHLGAEDILYLLDKCFGVVVAADTNLYMVCT